MPRLRMSDNRGDIIAEKEIFVEFPVEQKKKLMLGMRFCNPAQRLKGELPDTLQPVFQQQTCVNGNFHNTKTKMRQNYAKRESFLSLLVR